MAEVEYDLERRQDTAGTWHLRLVPCQAPGTSDDGTFQARLGYLLYLIGRGLARFAHEPSEGTA